MWSLENLLGVISDLYQPVLYRIVYNRTHIVAPQSTVRNHFLFPWNSCVIFLICLHSRAIFRDFRALESRDSRFYFSTKMPDTAVRDFKLMEVIESTVLVLNVERQRCPRDDVFSSSSLDINQNSNSESLNLFITFCIRIGCRHLPKRHLSLIWSPLGHISRVSLIN